MDQVEKFLRLLDAKRRAKVLNALRAIRAGDIANLDIKKLQGNNHLYRCRIGNVRIIFGRKPDGTFFPIDAHFRGSAYKP